MSRPIQAIVFDLDGTLLDTEGTSTQATEIALAPYTDRKIDWAIKEQILGLRSEEWSKILVEKFQLQGSLSATKLASEWEQNMGININILCLFCMGTRRKEIVLELLSSQMMKMKGADELTAYFFEKGIPMAIATSSTYNSVEKKKKFHSELFARMKFVVCGDDDRVKSGKPSPDLYLLAGLQ